jgi:ribosomal protein S25
VKKKSLASMEKQQESEDEGPASGEVQKGKKTKEKAAPQPQKRLPFLAPKMSDAEMVKALAPLKAVTLHTASRALGVNASVASGLLRDLEDKKMIARVGGFSGHFVWTVRAAS